MNWRLQLLTTGLITVWGVIAIRLLFVQLWQHDDFALRAYRQQRFVETIPARPGDIVDRKGRLLATTLRVSSLYVDPSRIADITKTAAALAHALALDVDELADRLESRSDRQFLWIKRRLSADEESRLLALDLPNDEWGLREEFRRRYPHRRLAAHLLGWRNIDGVGQAGVERSLDHRLSGTDGQRTLVRDARGYVLDVLEEVTEPPSHGETLTLTLDVTIQAEVERRLDRLMDEWQAQAASVIVLDPQTCGVLAMASRPTFDPNAPADSPPSAWINRATSQAFEPGSTLKPIIAAWAVDSGVIDRNETFDCGRGEYRMGTRILHDSHPHGRLDVEGILVKSSNIGMAQIGQRLTNAGLYTALQTFGFGRRTGIELPSEAKGLLRPLDRWDAYSTGSIPMGQEIAATPLQIIRAHAAIAGGGRLITPHLTLRRESSQRLPSDVVMTRVLDPSTAEWITTGPLTRVVQSGTARRSQLDGIDVFAKTGTAQKYDAETGAYSTDRYVSSCVCGGPASSPSAIVLVTVDEAIAKGEPYGGLVAGPTAAAILKTTLDELGTLTPIAVRGADDHRR